eukprot:1188528-Prorocentrum_minimum.AAC.6
MVVTYTVRRANQLDKNRQLAAAERQDPHPITPLSFDASTCLHQLHSTYKLGAARNGVVCARLFFEGEFSRIWLEKNEKVQPLQARSRYLPRPTTPTVTFL